MEGFTGLIRIFDDFARFSTGYKNVNGLGGEMWGSQMSRNWGENGENSECDFPATLLKISFAPAPAASASGFPLLNAFPSASR